MMDLDFCDKPAVEQDPNETWEYDRGVRVSDISLRDAHAAVPDVSVILATFEAGPGIRQTIECVLAQTLNNFELIIVDDCSKDETLPVIRGYDDPRVRIFVTPRNLGQGGARNQAAHIARGRFIAGLSQNDLCHPDRLAAQAAYLDRHPDVVVLGTATTIRRDDKQFPDRFPPYTTPAFLWWMLHVMNPLVWSSVMVRTDAVRSLGQFTRDAYPLAEDFDLYHRLGGTGRIARLDAPLVTRRWRDTPDSHLRDLRMSDSATKVLTRTFQPWFGPASQAYAELMVVHVAGGKPVTEAATLDRIGAIFQSVERAFATAYKPDAESQALIGAEMSRLWWDIARTTIRSGAVSKTQVLASRPAFAAQDGLTARDLFRSGLIGGLRARRRR